MQPNQTTTRTRAKATKNNHHKFIVCTKIYYATKEKSLIRTHKTLGMTIEIKTCGKRVENENTIAIMAATSNEVETVLFR